jgi:hypothetical protein
MDKRKWFARWLNATARVQCVACNRVIGRSSSVGHLIKVGNWYLPYCDACHSELLQNYWELDAITSAHQMARLANDGQCAKCTKSGDPYKMSDPLRDEVLLLSFWRPKRVRGDENRLSQQLTPSGPIVVAAMVSLCSQCIYQMLPRFSKEWGASAKKYWHLQHRLIPM